MKNFLNPKQLIIDTTNNYCILALINKHHNIIDQAIVQTHNNLTEFVTTLLNQLLSKNHIDYCDLNAIYVVIGPGSFTGVKVGVSITKTICSVYPKIKVYWSDSVSIVCNYEGLGCIDAKSNLFYVIGYQNQKQILELKYITEDELKKIKQAYQNVTFLNQINIQKYFHNLISNLNKFHYLKDYHLLLPAYLKPALYNINQKSKENYGNQSNVINNSQH